MKDLIKSKVFISAFLLTYFLFFFVTVLVFDFKRQGFGVGNYDYGFPFTYYHSTCYGGSYIWSGLFDNILFAAIISSVTGLSFSYSAVVIFSPKFQKKWAEFRAKWYI